MSDRLITITIGIGRNGDIYEDQNNHGNSFADVYRGMHAVRDEVDRLIRERRNCPELRKQIMNQTQPHKNVLPSIPAVEYGAIEAVVIRADGSVENLGVVAEYKPSLLSRIKKKCRSLLPS